MQLHIQVINLDRSPERLAAIGADLDGIGASWSRVQAVAPDEDYARTVKTYDRLRANYLFGRDLTRGEVGCFLSHLSALRGLLVSGHEIGLILEDDAKIDSEAASMIKDIATSLGGIDPLWACVNLSHTTALRRRRIASISGNTLYRAYQFPLLTAALLWHKDGARKFTNWCDDVGIYAPIDNQIRDWITLGGHGFSVAHPPVAMRDFATTIADRPRGNAAGAKKGKTNKFNKYELRQKLPLYWRSGTAYLMRW